MSCPARKVSVGTYCLVPGCKSTGRKTPDKTFLTIPRDPKRRNLWLKAIRRNVSDISAKTVGYVCEDHFNLEEDLDNYIKFKYYGATNIKLKPGVVPRIFQCQPDRITGRTIPNRLSSVNRVRKNLVTSLIGLESPSSSTCEDLSLTNVENNPEHEINLEVTNAGVFQTTPQKTPQIVLTPEKCEAARILCHLHHNKSLNEKQMADKGIQVKILPPRVSQGTYCAILNDRLKPILVDKSTSPLRISCLVQKGQSNPIIVPSTSSSSPSYSQSSYTCQSIISSSDSDFEILDLQNQSRLVNVKLFSADPAYFMGVPKSKMYVVDSLIECIGNRKVDVLLCLSKIRLDIKFKWLGLLFGYSESHVSKIFRKNIPIISQCISKLIKWPDSMEIKKRLPIYFRARYSNVQSIIDCFEIQIEKPSDPLKQTLTWSQYKKANTIKYIISCTPDGYINFISGGFGGRTSDAKLVELSGYLNMVPKNSKVLADRGFKGVAHLLNKVGCELLRPPSVVSGQKCSQYEVMASKRIASLRVLIERVIRRVREFSILKPHSCVNHELVKYLDDMVIIAVGLANLQDPLIKLYS